MSDTRRAKAKPEPTIKDLVDAHMVVTIEQGLSGGYIAMVGEYSGVECANVWAALRSARSRVPKAVTV